MVYVISSIYIIVFIVIYCFPPFAPPINGQSMNYACLITGGLTVLVGGFYIWKRSRGYKGPEVLLEEVSRVAIGKIWAPDDSAESSQRKEECKG